jgi:hypothetical protein
MRVDTAGAADTGAGRTASRTALSKLRRFMPIDEADLAAIVTRRIDDLLEQLESFHGVRKAGAGMVHGPGE